MSSAAQIAANIENAKRSTGPQTPEGKAVSSRNGIRHGLFATGDFVRPEAEPAYAELTAELNRELAPVGILEGTLVNEIRRAMWRLRRCGEVEANLVTRLDEHTGYIFDPMESGDAGAEKAQISVDRARAQAHRLLHKCTAELRKLQADRRAREKESSVIPASAPKPLATTTRTQSPQTENPRTVIEMTKQTPPIPVPQADPLLAKLLAMSIPA